MLLFSDGLTKSKGCHRSQPDLTDVPNVSEMSQVTGAAESFQLVQYCQVHSTVINMIRD